MFFECDVVAVEKLAVIAKVEVVVVSVPSQVLDTS